MVFVFARNKINEKWNTSGLSSQQSFPKFMKLQGKTRVLFYMLLVKLKCLNGKEKLRLINTIGISCKVSECWKVYSNCLLPLERRRVPYWNQGAIVQTNESKNFSVFTNRGKVDVASIKRVYYQVFYSSRVDENHHTWYFVARQWLDCWQWE